MGHSSKCGTMYISLVKPHNHSCEMGTVVIIPNFQRILRHIEIK